MAIKLVAVSQCNLEGETTEVQREGWMEGGQLIRERVEGPGEPLSAPYFSLLLGAWLHPGVGLGLEISLSLSVSEGTRVGPRWRDKEQVSYTHSEAKLPAGWWDMELQLSPVQQGPGRSMEFSGQCRGRIWETDYGSTHESNISILAGKNRGVVAGERMGIQFGSSGKED